MTYQKFQRALQVALGALALFGVWLLVSPGSVASVVGESQRLEGVGGHAFGFALLLLAMMAAPAVVVPRANRLLGLQVALVGVALGVFFAIVGGGFWAPAVVLVALGVMVILAFWRDYRADLMAKP